MHRPQDIRVSATPEGVCYLDRPDSASTAETRIVRWEDVHDICANKCHENGAIAVHLVFATGDSLYRVSCDMEGWNDFVAFLSAHLAEHMTVKTPDWVRCLELMEPNGRPMLVALKEHSKLQLLADEPDLWWTGPEPRSD